MGGKGGGFLKMVRYVSVCGGWEGFVGVVVFVEVELGGVYRRKAGWGRF